MPYRVARGSTAPPEPLAPSWRAVGEENSSAARATLWRPQVILSNPSPHRGLAMTRRTTKDDNCPTGSDGTATTAAVDDDDDDDDGGDSAGAPLKDDGSTSAEGASEGDSEPT